MAGVGPGAATDERPLSDAWGDQMLLSFESGVTKSIKNASSAEAPKYKWIGIILVYEVKPDTR